MCVCVFSPFSLINVGCGQKNILPVSWWIWWKLGTGTVHTGTMIMKSKHLGSQNKQGSRIPEHRLETERFQSTSLMDHVSNAGFQSRLFFFFSFGNGGSKLEDSRWSPLKDLWKGSQRGRNWPNARWHKRLASGERPNSMDIQREREYWIQFWVSFSCFFFVATAAPPPPLPPPVEEIKSNTKNIRRPLNRLPTDWVHWWTDWGHKGHRWGQLIDSDVDVLRTPFSFSFF